MVETRHKILFTGEYFVRSLYLSIDFEPIELRLTNDLSKYFNYMNAEKWQFVIDYCCHVLGKPKKEVYCSRDTPTAQGCFVNEFLAKGDWNWTYYTHSKIYNLPHFYQWYEVVAPGRGDYNFQSHYGEVNDYLKRQGVLTGSKSFFEPSHALIDSLLKKIL